jgi:hypothetical protein
MFLIKFKMGNNSSTSPPEYNKIFKTKEIEKPKEIVIETKEESIYHEISNHYNLGNKFNRLEKYFSKLTFDDIFNPHRYIDFVEIAEPKDKIIMTVFSRQYMDEYKSYIRNLKKK